MFFFFGNAQMAILVRKTKIPQHQRVCGISDDELLKLGVAIDVAFHVQLVPADSGHVYADEGLSVKLHVFANQQYVALDAGSDFVEGNHVSDGVQRDAITICQSCLGVLHVHTPFEFLREYYNREHRICQEFLC